MPNFITKTDLSPKFVLEWSVLTKNDGQFAPKSGNQFDQIFRTL